MKNILALLLVTLLLVTPVPVAQAQTDRLCFEETGQCVAARLREYWEQNGGLAVFGYPISHERYEHNADTGGVYSTQWFQRTRLELHPENQPPHDVLLGRLGNDRLLRLGRTWQPGGPGNGEGRNCLRFEQTGYSVCDQGTSTGFRTYWQTHGLEFDGKPGTSAAESLAFFGLPLTEPREERNANGDTILTQWFERARFEWHPANPPEYQVLLGLLGTEILLDADEAVTPSSAVTLGAYIDGAPWNTAKMDEFVALVGRMPTLTLWYQDWADSGAFNRDRMEAVLSRGSMPLVTWEPWNHNDGVTQPAFTLQAIVDGRHDAYIRRWAADAAAWGKPVYLRWAQNMNVDEYPWSVGIGGNTPEQYVAAWRHVVDVFREAGATNVRWVWSPYVVPGGVPFEPMYPGDAYVDWVALDGYNEVSSRTQTTWRPLADIFGPSYDALTRLTQKPLMIAEVASAEQGGDKAAWIKQGLLVEVPTRFPRVRAVVWFHGVRTQDWRVDSSPAALAAFREVVTAPVYAGRLP